MKGEQKMSMVEMAKDALNGVKRLSEKKYAINILNRTMRMVAAILLVTIFANDRFDFGIPFSKVTLNLWDETLREVLNYNVYKICIFWSAYELIISNVIRWLCIHFDETEELKSIPILFTLNDLVDFVCSIYFLVYAINRLIERNNGMSDIDIGMSTISGIYIFIGFVNWLYIKNDNNWYYIHRKYTNYYDTNNIRIAEKTNVIYHGKRYRVYFGDGGVGLNEKSQKKEWRLKAWGDNESISLEEAVKDKEGNLIVETWKDRYGSGE